MAKIAVELESVIARRTANGGPGGTASRVLGQGHGWHAADVVCTCGPQDRRFEERHAHVTIAIVVEGTFQYRGSAGRSGTAQELMTPGSLLLGNTGQGFECGHEHGFGDRCLSFRYTQDYFERLATDAGISSTQRNFSMLRLPPLRRLSPVIARACAALASGEDAPWEELSVQLATEVMALAHGPLRGSNDAPASAIARVTRAVRLIERDAEGDLSLGDLAREARLSPYHFLRIFQQLTGVTPHQYVRRLRLRRAAARLASEQEKVLDIALDCGFGDVSNFNHAFRAEFGVNPRTWKTRSIYETPLL